MTDKAQAQSAGAERLWRHDNVSVFRLDDGHATSLARRPSYATDEEWRETCGSIITAVNERDSLLARVEELEAALRTIEAETNGPRITVRESNAFGAWARLNETHMRIRNLALAALKGGR